MRRRLAALLLLVAAFVAIPGVATAHGLGGRSDLPVPLEYFLVGAGIVLLLTFGGLALLWPTVRLQDGPRYRGRGIALPRWVAAVVGGLAVAYLLLVIVAGRFGDPGRLTNIAPVSVFVVLWLVLPFAAAVIGNHWAVSNPWAVLGRGLRLGPEGASASPGRIGVWGAAVAFLAFTWLELVYDTSADPRVLGWAAVVYTAYMLTSMALLGVDRATTSMDAFSMYHRTVSAIAPIGRDPETGRVRRRGWLRALPVLPQWPGLATFVIVMIGTVTYDGLSATPWWRDVTSFAGSSADADWFQTLALVFVVAVVGAAYLAASWAAALVADQEGLGAVEVARSFAHTLVPIALAYAVAHYFTLILFEGQVFFAAISDPLGKGWDLFGTADYRIDFAWLSPTTVWWVQLIAIVGGHVAGVVLAHDRSLAVFTSQRAVRSQYAMLGLMVALTGLGLTILAAG